LQLSKTDFLQFLHCPKSLWLLRRKPTLYKHGPFSDYLQKIVSEGYEVELYLKSLFSSQIDSDKYSYQTGFKTGDGLYAIADCTRQNDDGSIDIYEVKSSTSVQRGSPHRGVSVSVRSRNVDGHSGHVRYLSCPSGSSMNQILFSYSRI